MTGALRDSVIVITGAASGIGLATVCVAPDRGAPPPLARGATGSFGGIGAGIEDAAVSASGRVEAARTSVFRRVVETEPPPAPEGGPSRGGDLHRRGG